MDLEIGRKKATYRIRLIDVETGKSKMVSVYRKGKKKLLSQVMAIIIDAFRQD